MASSTSSHDDAMAISATPNVNAVVVRPPDADHRRVGIARTRRSSVHSTSPTTTSSRSTRTRTCCAKCSPTPSRSARRATMMCKKYRRDLDRAKDELTEERERRHQVQTQLQRVPEQIHKSIVSLDATPMVDLRRQCEFHNLHCAKRKRGHGHRTARQSSGTGCEGQPRGCRSKSDGENGRWTTVVCAKHGALHRRFLRMRRAVVRG